MVIQHPPLRAKDPQNLLYVDSLVAGKDLPQRTRVVIPTYADREKAAKEKRRAASIFGAPKPVPGT